jgi:hypothetical protein
VATPPAKAALDLISRETLSRIEKLYKHYDVDIAHPLAGGMLAHRLACEFIPNFEPFPLPAIGRPRNVLQKHHSLVIAIEALLEDNGRKVFEACRALTKRDTPWKGHPPKELQAAYYRYQKELRSIRTHLPAQAVTMLEAKLREYESRS